jgi:hypothetical protein
MTTNAALVWFEHSTYQGAIARACPVCGANPGQLCATTSDHVLMDQPHPQRLKATR